MMQEHTLHVDNLTDMTVAKGFTSAIGMSCFNNYLCLYTLDSQ